MQSRLERSLDKLPKKDKLIILNKIESLMLNPRPQGIKALQGKCSGYYRLRVGNYRIIYSIEDEIFTILVVKVAQLGGIYEGW